MATPNPSAKGATHSAAPKVAHIQLFEYPCRGYGVVTLLTNPDRMRLEVQDEWGDLRVSHEVELE